MFEDIEEVLFSEEDIKKKVRELGGKISKDYKGKDLLLVSVLRGGVVFLADLIRHISIPVSVDFMAISSYGSTTESLGVVKLIKDLEESIDKKHVLVVEDIIDTGLTLNYLLRNLQSRHPASLKVCALLDKSVRRIVDIPIDYKGFDVPDVFVVGYGLDYEQKYRNLPFIGILKPEVYGE
ncbi:MAG: hypoxanthine phosphoribosyltransferase [Actinomycetota bacterium]